MPVSPITLTGRFVRLEPLRPEHAAGLCCAADEGTFAFMPSRPEQMDLGGFLLYTRRLIDDPATVSFAVIDPATDRVLGTTSYLDIRPAHRGLEIGMTWLTPDVRGGPVNPEMKLLLMSHAFESPLFGSGPAARPALRVQLKTDARNIQSQRAMERLGLVREGTLRRHMVLPDGFVRDTVMFSVIDTEWPAMRDRLIALVEQRSQR
jgi:RimJ/RimL family protein N-acetyltransferase